MSSATLTGYRNQAQGNRDSQVWRPSPAPGFKQLGLAALAAIAIASPVFLAGGAVMYRDRAARESDRLAFQERMRSHERLVAAPSLGQLTVAPAAHGRDLFESTCAVCHNMDGTGVGGLGKNLTQSWFIASLDDAELRAFIAKGRPLGDPLNTTKIPMPPRGGHDELTDSDVGDIVVYVRGLQDPRRLPALPPSAAALAAAAPVSDAEKAVALAAAGGDAELAEFIAHGTKVYAGTCAACHGKDAKGLTGLGKDLTISDFAKKLDDDGLLAFLKRGRDPGDPLNTTKVGMPPKGGNPALSDDDLLDVISYVRALQKQGGATQ